VAPPIVSTASLPHKNKSQEDERMTTTAQAVSTRAHLDALFEELDPPKPRIFENMGGCLETLPLEPPNTELLQ
jgi:hypothetical protein